MLSYFRRLNVSDVAATLFVGFAAVTLALGIGMGRTDGTNEVKLVAVADAHEHGAGHSHEAAMSQPVHRTEGLAITAPAMTLTADDETSVNFAALLKDERPVYVNFIYTSCTSVCPMMSQIFSELEGLLASKKDSARLISISIDPDFDTPARLREYASNFRKGKDWLFLTGTPKASVTVQRAFSVYTIDKMSHAVVTFYRAKPDAPWVRIDGFATAEQLVEERSTSATTSHAAEDHM